MKTWAIALVLICMAPAAVQAQWLDFWLTPDQQGQKLFDQGNYSAAAEKFTTPERIGASLFKAGEFEQAAAVFGRSSTPESTYNRGNALLMQGLYDQAITSYRSALERKPGWAEAQQNLEIALLRKEALAPPDDDYGGTGGMLEADEIVIDTSGRVDNSSSQQVVEDGAEDMSEEAMRSLWLRRVETRPADFLAAKFAYQLATQSGTEDVGE